MQGLASASKPRIECSRIIPTVERPGSQGTYIVRLSENNRRRLRVRNGVYLRYAVFAL